MGIPAPLAEMIFAEHTYKPIRGRALSLGRQTILLSRDKFVEFVGRHNLPYSASLIKIDVETVQSRQAPHIQYVSDRSFYSSFSSARWDVMDVTDYEGANIICDLGGEIPGELCGQYDFIFNGSVLDNIFDAAGAMRNITRMLKPGGRVMHIEMATNLSFEYLIFSPDWFFDFYTINKFADCKVYIATFKDVDGLLYGPWDLVSYRPRANGDGISVRSLGPGLRAVVIVIAEAGEESTVGANPIQWCYRDEAAKRSHHAGLVGFDASARPVIGMAPGKVPDGFAPCARIGDNGIEPAAPVAPAPEAAGLLQAPYNADKRREISDQLPDPQSRAAFVDFMMREILSEDHHTVFWGDRMMTLDKSMGFFDDPAFVKVWERVRGAHQYDQYDNRQSIAWRMHTLVWAARSALALPEGDFVECGVFQGDMSYVVYHAAGLAGSGRHMHLFDSFEGIDPGRTVPGEYGPSAENYVSYANSHYKRTGLYEGVIDRFAGLPEVSVHKGFLPEALRGRAPAKIAWLHIDLNAAKPEVETLEVLFDRVVPSGMVIFDDYGWLVLKAQKDAEDDFFAKRGYQVLELPTGQGLVVKRPNPRRGLFGF